MMEEPRLPDAVLKLEIGPYQINGCLKNIYSSQMVLWRCAAAKARDLLFAWLEHLLLLAAGKDGYPRQTRFTAADKSWVFDPVDNPTGHMQKLVEIFQQGQTRPVPFFPETSFTFAETLHNRLDPETAICRARSKWAGNRFDPIDAESENPYCRQAFGRVDPLGEEWQHLSVEVYEPILCHRRTVK